MKPKRDNIKQLIALLQKKKFHDALRLGEKVDNEQRSYLFFDIMGTAYVETGQIKLAISSFHRSIYLNNQFIPSYVNLGKAMTKIKNFKTAEQAFNKALQLNNSETQALIGKGLIKVKQGLLREAAKFYEASLQIKLDRFAVRTLAAIYTNLWEDKKDFNDLLRAKELLEKDFSVFPNDTGTTLHQLSGLMARMSFIKFSEKDYSLIPF